MAKAKPILEDIFEGMAPFEDDTDPLCEEADKLLVLFEEAPIKHKLNRQWAWMKAVARAVYRDTEPKEIPIEDLRIIAKLGADDPLNTKPFERIKSPTSAIRGFCLNCQGGSMSGVRNCTAVHCVLFPFRMGSNPFFGRIADADVAAEDIPEPEETTDADQEA